MAKKSLNLAGVIPPMPTPFDSKGALAADQLSSNVKVWNEFGLRGMLVLGSNGEFVMMSADEKIRAVEAVKASIAPDKLLLAGTGCSTTEETIAVSKRAQAAGADALLVLHPHYYKSLMTDEALRGFFFKVADAVDVPVLVYNMPGCTGMDLSAKLLIELASHENIIGWKDSGSNIVKMEAVVKAKGDDFQLLIGSASLLLPALSIGAVGGIMALANIAPAECIKLIELFGSGNVAAARELQLNMTPVNNAVTATYAMPGLKHVMHQLGLYGGPCREPILPLGEKEAGQLDALIRDAGIRPFRTTAKA
ncbi:MAG: dihydrodipicolinate synthase family protein [Flavobacteriales bacterium]|nr:dihydrodipicolinate synthase family protein [Flavobacteriales bacterium]